VVTAVAGETRITMDMRHISAHSLQAMFDEAHEAAAAAAEAEGCTIEWEHIFRIPPMPFHPALLDAARRAVQAVEGHDVELPSGALHDASEVAREIPTVMIFSSSTAGLSHTVIPAKVDGAIAERARTMAIAACRAVAAAGLSRVDFFFEEATGALWLNEINTLPGFTSQSMYPMLWEATGLPLEELVHKLVQLAQESSPPTGASLEPR
jgi:hypothetical protein